MKFYKYIIALLLLTFGHAYLFSQTHYSSNVSIGGKAGLDLSRVFFNPSVKQGMLPGATIGFMFRYVEETHFGIVAELNFSQRGWKENFETDRFSYSRFINYLEIPVFAHIYFGKRGKFFFNAGPQVGLKLNDKISANFDPYQIQNIPDFPLRNRRYEQLTMDVTQKVDYGISAGLGGEFSINPNHSVNLEARFYFGLGNIFPSKRADTFHASNQMTLSATVGYWFRIK